MRFNIDSRFPCLLSEFYSHNEGDKPDGEKYDNTVAYDPDLAHPAAFNDAETAIPTNVNERKLLRKIDIRVIPVLR